MRDKEQHVAPDCCDDKTAGTLAASSVARFFKDHHWKIISFFPNADCPNRVEKVLRPGKKAGRKTKRSEKPGV